MRLCERPTVPAQGIAVRTVNWLAELKTSLFARIHTASPSQGAAPAEPPNAGPRCERLPAISAAWRQAYGLDFLAERATGSPRPGPGRGVGGERRNAPATRSTDSAEACWIHSGQEMLARGLAVFLDPSIPPRPGDRPAFRPKFLLSFLQLAGVDRGTGWCGPAP